MPKERKNWYKRAPTGHICVDLSIKKNNEGYGLENRRKEKKSWVCTGIEQKRSRESFLLHKNTSQ